MDNTLTRFFAVAALEMNEKRTLYLHITFRCDEWRDQKKKFFYRVHCDDTGEHAHLLLWPAQIVQLHRTRSFFFIQFRSLTRANRIFEIV